MAYLEHDATKNSKLHINLGLEEFSQCLNEKINILRTDYNTISFIKVKACEH